MEEQEITKMVNQLDEELNINLTMMQSMCIVGHIELALRHPENNGPAAFIAKKTAEHLIYKMLETWPAFRERKDLMEAWQSVFDINFNQERGAQNGRITG